MNPEVLDRLPPQSLESERGVIGSILLDPELCDDVASVVKADDFYADANKKLFQAVEAMHDESGRVDTTLLMERLKRDGNLEAVGGLSYIAQVAQSVPYAITLLLYWLFPWWYRGQGDLVGVVRRRQVPLWSRLSSTQHCSSGKSNSGHVGAS